MNEENKIKKALSLAIRALYFEDSSDYETYLWQIADTLDPHSCKLLEEEPHEAYRIFCAEVDN